jgi:hypothetical protein
MSRASCGAEDDASICRSAGLHIEETFSVGGRRVFVWEELLMGLMWMAVGSGEDRLVVKRRGGGRQWEKPKKPLGRELE